MRDALPAARDEVFLIGLHVGLLGHLLDVGAGREGLFIAGQHDRADRRIGFEIVERRADLGDEGGVQRVERLRPVQRNDADRAAPLEQDVCVLPASHDTAPTLRSRQWRRGPVCLRVSLRVPESGR